jgi:hypothetical protein
LINASCSSSTYDTLPPYLTDVSPTNGQIVDLSYQILGTLVDDFPGPYSIYIYASVSGSRETLTNFSITGSNWNCTVTRMNEGWTTNILQGFDAVGLPSTEVSIAVHCLHP